MGSGVIGTTTAWYLARAGFEVTVVDRQPGPALETSFANAGQVSPGYASPWAAPGVPLKAFKWLFQQHAPLAIRPGLDPRQYTWLLRMLANCTSARYARNKARMVRLSEYSRDCLDELVQATGIAYEGRRLGTVQLFRSQAQLDGAAKDVAVLDQYGVPYQLLDPAGIARYEPALAQAPVQLVGALRLPNDQTGDCNLFTQRLEAMARQAGVEFRYNTRVEAIHGDGHRVSGVRLNGKVEKADRYVLALGSHSPQLAAPLGLDLPVYPLKGYSLTLPITDAAMAPVSTVLDESYKVAHHPFRCAHPGRRHGRSGRLRPVAQPAPAPDPGTGGGRPVSGGRRAGGGPVLDRPAPGHARWHAHRRRHAAVQPLHQHRPRHAGLDHGLRLGPLPGRPDGGPGAGDRS